MLGSLSAQYESNGNPGTVSTGYGDAGGVSYGAYQFASNCGVPGAFVSWLRAEAPDFYSVLAGLPIPSEAFNRAWKAVAATNPDRFYDLQHKYTKEVYYDREVRLLKSAYFNIENHSEVMKDVVWSRAVQYGVGNIVEMFEEAVKHMGYPNLSYVDDARFDHDLIKNIYLKVCMTPEWTNGSPALREGLYSRFRNECAVALRRLEMEGY